MSDLTIKHTAKYQDGKLVLNNKELFLWDLENYKGKDIELIIRGVKDTRSNRMNRYYWSVIMKALTDYFNEEQTFNKKINTEEVHELMKMKFLGTIFWDLPHGETMEAVESSKKLTNTEFISYFENIIAWAAELFDLQIPKPNEEQMLAIDIQDKDKYIDNESKNNLS